MSYLRSNKPKFPIISHLDRQQGTMDYMLVFVAAGLGVAAAVTVVKLVEKDAYVMALLVLWKFGSIISKIAASTKRNSEIGFEAEFTN
jgi:hypothetical protein